MIVAKTKLKKIPDKCTNCKFCIHTSEYKKMQKKLFYENYTGKRCLITGAEVPEVYNNVKRTWEFTKCRSCPLEEAEIVI